MLIFSTQITNPDEKDRIRFDKIKKKMGELYRKEQKQKAKFSSSEKMIIKAGQNWMAVHTFI